MLPFEKPTSDRASNPFPVVRRVAGLLARLCLVFGVVVTLAACDSGGSGDSEPPSAPSNLTATSEDGEVSLNWDRVSAEDLAGYNVYRSTSPIDSLNSSSRVTSISVTEFDDPSVQNQTTYYYQVTAVDQSANESEPSGEEEVTPFGGPQNRP